MKALTLKPDYQNLYKKSLVSNHPNFTLDKVRRTCKKIDVVNVDKLIEACQKNIEGRRCDYFVFYTINEKKRQVGIYIIEAGDTKKIKDAKEQIQGGAQLLDDHLEHLCQDKSSKTFHFMPVVATDKLVMIKEGRKSKREKKSKREQMPTISCHLCHEPNKVLEHIKLGAPLEPLAL